jgi:hypothetical protein
VTKTAHTSLEMDDRCQLLTSRAIVTTEGAMSVHSGEEVKDIIQFHFGISNLEFLVYHSNPEPFLTIFRDEHDRDTIFTMMILIEGQDLEAYWAGCQAG